MTSRPSAPLGYWVIMGSGKATLPEVAREAGVSTSTAARVLGGYSRVSPERQAAVLDAARRLGYTPNELARSLITGRSSTLGLVIGDVENPFFATLARHAIAAARERGFDVFVVNTDENAASEAELIRTLRAKRVAGLIVAPTSSSTELFSEQVAGDVPIVIVDGTSDAPRGSAITVDNERASAEAVDELVGAGHRSIAFLARSEPALAGTPTDSFASPSGAARFTGFISALAAHGVEATSDMALRAGLSVDDAMRAAASLLDRDERPTAIVTASSVIALGVLRAARARGLAVPTELSLITFDDPEWASVAAPPLTCIAQPIAEIGRLAVDDLVATIRGIAPGPRHRALATTLIRRDSVAAPPH